MFFYLQDEDEKLRQLRLMNDITNVILKYFKMLKALPSSIFFLIQPVVISFDKQ